MLVTEDLALLVDAARAAAEIAERHFGQAPEAWDKPGGQGPVTEADLEIDRMLREELGAARPDYGWLSEETADSPARLAQERVFIVDPIDGTRAFMAGQPDFAHSLAIARDGAIEDAVVYLPKRGLLYTASRGAGAQLNAAPVRARARESLEGAEVLTSRAALDPAIWVGGLPPFRRKFRPSLAWRLALVGEGRHDAMLTVRPAWEWDIAAGALIAEEAGARVTDAEGRPLRFNAPSARSAGVIAAAEPLHGAILGRLRGPGGAAASA